MQNDEQPSRPLDSRSASPEPLPSRRLGRFDGALWSGLGAGLVGGVVMLLFAMIVTAARGLGFWLPARGIAASVLGVTALVMGGGAVVLGVALHLAVAAAWGLLFSWLFAWLAGHEPQPAFALLVGIVYGLLVLAVMTWLVLPWLDPTWFVRVRAMSTMWIGAHLLYGASMVFVPMFTAVARSRRWAIAA